MGFPQELDEDITLEKENKRVMENLAFYDPLTGLANRSLLTERFNQLHGLYKRENKKFGVMFIDLDKFKFIKFYQNFVLFF